jgi:hypothetical protein
MEGMHVIGGILLKDKFQLCVQLHVVYLYMSYIYEYFLYMLYA